MYIKRGKIADDKICQNDDNRYINLSWFRLRFLARNRLNYLHFMAYTVL